MNHDSPIRGPLPSSGPDPGAKPTPKQGTGGGVAFRALIEKLETQARELREQSNEVDDPAGLAGAVDSARSSVDDAVSLGDKLLEAFRAAQQRGEQESESD